MIGLGVLEGEVMNILWRAGSPMKVREVLVECTRHDRLLAYTTIMTVLDNLYRKVWVDRTLDRGAYRYEPTLSREAAASRALRQVLNESGDAEAALLHFVRSASDHESTMIEDALRHRH